MKIKMQTAVAYGQSKEVGIYALASVVNALAADGVESPAVQVRIIIPAYAFKSRMHTMEKIIKKMCDERKIILQDMKSERSVVITQSMVVVTGSGCVKQDVKEEDSLAGQDVVLTKFIGMEGMLRILGEKGEELKSRFSLSFLKQMEDYKNDIFALEEIACAKIYGVNQIYQMGEGGVFAALWNLAKETGCGLEIDLKAIPVLQETIEVCEFFRLNPYQLTSTGALLIVTGDGEGLVEKLSQMEIPAAVIGKLTDNNDKILKNGEEIRYIDRPAPDELLKIFE